MEPSKARKLRKSIRDNDKGSTTKPSEGYTIKAKPSIYHSPYLQQSSISEYLDISIDGNTTSPTKKEEITEVITIEDLAKGNLKCPLSGINLDIGDLIIMIELSENFQSSKVIALSRRVFHVETLRKLLTPVLLRDSSHKDIPCIVFTGDIESFIKKGYTELPRCGTYFPESAFSEKGVSKDQILKSYIPGTFYKFIQVNRAVYEKDDLEDRSRVEDSHALYHLIQKYFPYKNHTLEDLGFKSVTHSITEGDKGTFGVELETISGVVPTSASEGLNLNTVYDGSLKDDNGMALGGEYVTGVLHGDNGFKHLRLICRELAQRCSLNRKCGVHVHVSIDYSQAYMVALYQLCKALEPEIEAFMPPSRRNNEYCRKLDISLEYFPRLRSKSPIEQELEIKEAFEELYKYVGDGRAPDSNINRRRNHPKGNKCGYDHSSQRYCWVNFVPALFNTRGDGKTFTVEFRNHGGSLSYTKIRNWIKICMAIQHYASTNTYSILEGNIPSLTSLIQAVYPKTGVKLILYIQERTEKFRRYSATQELAEMGEITEKDKETSEKIKDL